MILYNREHTVEWVKPFLRRIERFIDCYWPLVYRNTYDKILEELHDERHKNLTLSDYTKSLMKELYDKSPILKPSYNTEVDCQSVEFKRITIKLTPIYYSMSFNYFDDFGPISKKFLIDKTIDQLSTVLRSDMIKALNATKF